MAFSEQWHCGVDVTGHNGVCRACVAEDGGPVFVFPGRACTRCGMVRPVWCDEEVAEGTLCTTHVERKARHMMAPKNVKESSRHARVVAAHMDRWHKRERVNLAETAAREVALMVDEMRDGPDIVAAALKAAQVAALTADTGAGQTVVMAPPDVRPIPAPIGVLRDELMRTLK